MHQDLFGSRETTVHNLFFGLVPDDATRGHMARAVDSLRAGHGLQGRWLKPVRYHMTLHFLGTFSELPRQRLEAACAAAAQVRHPGFELVLDRVGHFAQGIGWLGTTQPGPMLPQLWEELRSSLARAGIAPQGHARFVPHVTVLRDARTAMPEASLAPIRWPVREFVLIDSQLGTHSEYCMLGRWPLRQE